MLGKVVGRIQSKDRDSTSGARLVLQDYCCCQDRIKERPKDLGGMHHMCNKEISTMRRGIFKGWLAACALILAGCASDTPQISYQLPDQKLLDGGQKRIALFTIEEPDVYDVRVLRYPGPDSPGITLPGRIVGTTVTVAGRAADEAGRTFRLSQSIKEWNFNVGRTLTDEIKTRLAADGYQVEEVHVANHRHTTAYRNHQYLGTYPATTQPVDAYVHVYIEFAGYTAATPTQPYTPTLEVFMDVVNPDTKERKYATSLVYGGPVPVEDANNLPADPQFTVRDFEWLCAGPEKCEENPAVKGLRAASSGVADLATKHLLAH